MNSALERYLQGELTEEEEHRLRALLSQNSPLQRELQAIHAVQHAVTHLRSEEAPPFPDFTEKVMADLPPLNHLPNHPSALTPLVRWLHWPVIDWLVDHLSPRSVALATMCAMTLLMSSLGFISGTKLGRVEYVSVTPTLVPKTDIPPGIPLTPDLFTVKYIPTQAVPSQALQSFDRLEGRYAHALILANHPLDARYTRVARPHTNLFATTSEQLRPVKVTLELPPDQLAALSPGATLQLVLALDDSSTLRVTPLSSRATLINARPLESEPSADHMQRIEATVVVPSDEAAKIDFGKESGTVAIMLPS
jgi:hypothetical protein